MDGHVPVRRRQPQLVSEPLGHGELVTSRGGSTQRGEKRDPSRATVERLLQVAGPPAAAIISSQSAITSSRSSGPQTNTNRPCSAHASVAGSSRRRARLTPSRLSDGLRPALASRASSLARSPRPFSPTSTSASSRSVAATSRALDPAADSARRFAAEPADTMSTECWRAFRAEASRSAIMRRSFAPALAVPDVTAADLIVRNVLSTEVAGNVFQAGGGSTIQNSLELAGTLLQAVRLPRLRCSRQSRQPARYRREWLASTGRRQPDRRLPRVDWRKLPGKIGTKGGTVVSGTAYLGAAAPGGTKWWAGWTTYARN